MRKLFSHFIVTVIFAFSTNLMAQESFRIPEAVIKVHNQVNVGVFPQVELISIVQSISTYPTILGFLMTTDSFDYNTDVIHHFESFKDHPAVHMF